MQTNPGRIVVSLFLLLAGSAGAAEVELLNVYRHPRNGLRAVKQDRDL